jgi:addiction module HigA family antidote
MSGRKPAQVFHPSEFIREELEERGWTVAELARRMGCQLLSAIEIVEGRERITRNGAVWLQSAFQVSAEMWLNLQSTWDEAPPGARVGRE